MTTQQPSGWFTGRNRLITIASVAAIGMAGAVAIGANVGILNAADSNKVGTVASAGDLLTTTPQTVDVYLPGTPSTVAGAVAGSQEFAVDAAGTTTVSVDALGLHLLKVTPTFGWTWTSSQSAPTQLSVTFTNGSRTLVFTAVEGADGSIAANVSEPIVSQTANTSSGGGSSHEDDHNEYEGGSDDD